MPTAKKKTAKKKTAKKKVAKKEVEIPEVEIEMPDVVALVEEKVEEATEEETHEEEKGETKGILGTIGGFAEDILKAAAMQIVNKRVRRFVKIADLPSSITGGNTRSDF